MSEFGSIAQGLLGLRYLIRSAGLTEDVGITLTFKNPRELAQFQSERIRRVPMELMIKAGSTWGYLDAPYKFLGITITEKVAERPKTGKQWCVDTMFETDEGQPAMIRAINDGLGAMKRKGVAAERVDVLDSWVADPCDPDRMCRTKIVRVSGRDI